MNLLFLGDIVGRSGRKAVFEHVPQLRKDLALDFVVANCENAAGGFGVTEEICRDLFEAGIDVLTSGNHIWSQREILDYISLEERLLRPINFKSSAPGRGSGLFEAPGGRHVLVINVMGQLFMDPVDDPASAVERALDAFPLGETADAVVIDVHAEATSEKMSMGHLVDGHASLVVGSHTHVPTADAQILFNGTAYQTDAGMCGDYDSVIGMEKTVPLLRFRQGIPSGRLTPAGGEGTLCGTFVETSEDGLAKRIEPVRLGGCLSQHLPAL